MSSEFSYLHGKNQNYLNPKGEDSSYKIDGFMTTDKSKTRIGVAGLIFQPHPPNFENQYNF